MGFFYPSTPKSLQPPGGISGQMTGGVSNFVDTAKGHPGTPADAGAATQNPIQSACMSPVMGTSYGDAGMQALNDTLLKKGGQ
jgi:hypothetical protein